MVTADPDLQLRLLDLQSLDTQLAQLAHRRAALPELAMLAELRTRIEELDRQRVESRTRLSDVSLEQKRVEDDIDVVRQREQRDRDRLQSGGLPGKELERLQHELETLERRQSTLEDSALEIMEQREVLEQDTDRLTGQLDELGRRTAEARTTRDAAFTDIDGTAGRVNTERGELAAQLPADLVALYDKVRATAGGVGAAALRRRRCEGCHLELAGSELGEVRRAAPDAVVRCENCRRILVRTADSGL